MMQALQHLNFLAFMLVLTLIPPVITQDDDNPELILRLSRDFGYGLGGQIQGNFTYRVNTENISEKYELVRVEFLLDGEVIGEDSDAPFHWKFNTADYEQGAHRLSAIGHTISGQEIGSNTITRQFVSGRSVIWIVIAIVVLVVGFRIASYFLTRNSGSRGETKSGFGYLGGAICPNCSRPFGLHIWSIKLGVGRLDRCPYCGKWNLVRRSSPDDLVQAASLAEHNENGKNNIQANESDDSGEMKRRLEDSKFDN